MREHILFLTGKLARARLVRVLESMAPLEFSYEVRDIGLSVAALMTADMILRRVESTGDADRVVVPGLCRGDLDAVSARLGVPVIRGSEDLKDLPEFFGREARPVDLSRTDVLLFAEIVEAPELTAEQILERARGYAADGADVIDIGCLPDTPFPHLEEVVVALKAAGYRVSVDSMTPDELLCGGRAGADYLLSLSESTLWIADEVPSTPILIPETHKDMASLYRSVDRCAKSRRECYADSILDPIHFGFTESIMRYAELRRRYPDQPVMMGIGNLTELTEADTSGINAILFGLISELGIAAVLTTQISPHAASALREADLARRIMYAARRDDSLPKGIDPGLLVGHERKPFPDSPGEIAELAGEIRDPSYRVQVSEAGIHVYNRDGMEIGADPFDLFPRLALLSGDAPHAFYMGVELAKAHIALQLGKRYSQDEPLNWGVAVRQQEGAGGNGAAATDGKGYTAPGTTLTASGNRKGKRSQE